MDSPEPLGAGKTSIRQVIEAILFIGGEPLTLASGRRAAPAATEEILVEAVRSLNALYEAQQRPYRIVETPDGWRLQLLPPMLAWLRERLRPDRGVRLGRPQLEVLAVIAYRQPISRAAVEQLTKADAGPPLRQLLRRRLVAQTEPAAGGKTVHYATTARFLEVFGVESLEDLPMLEELNV